MRPGEAALDGWSLVHVGAGYALATVTRKPSTVLAMLIAYELYEAVVMRADADAAAKGLREYESPANIAADIACGMAGFWLATSRF